MTTSYQRLNRIRKADLFTDTLTAAQIAGIESSAVDHEDFLGGILSQFKRTIGATDWWSSVQDAAGEPRNLKTLTDDLYYKKIDRYRVVLADVAVPAAVRATGTLTGSANFADGETVTIGSTVYTFKSPFVDAAFNVAVGVDLQTSLANLKAAINLEAGGGTLYGTATTLHPTVSATASDATTLSARAKSYGTAGNAIATTDVAANASWGAATLTGGAGDAVVLSVASNQAPNEAAAVDTGSANGAIVKVLAGDVGAASLDEIAGLSAVQPKNLCEVRDATTFDPILSDSRKVYALLQAESGVVDGDTFSDTTKQAQLSFVRLTSGGDDLELCPATDIGGKSINYQYASRTELRSMNEQDFLFPAFADPQAASVTTLQEAYVGGNTIDVLTAEGNLVFNLSQDLTRFEVQRNSAAFATFLRDDTLGDKLTLDLDILDVNNVTDADFLNGAKFDTGATTINVGVTAGRVDATALTVASTAGDLNVNASAAVKFTTVRESALPLDDATAGAISALPGGPYASISAAIKAALTSSDVDVFVQEIQTNYAQDANVPGSGNGNAQDWSPALDLSARSISMLAADVSNLDTILFLNGSLLWGGSAVTNNEVYKGTTPANGDLKYDFAKGVKAGDVVIAISFKAG
jgi:hypothetical protein